MAACDPDSVIVTPGTPVSFRSRTCPLIVKTSRPDEVHVRLVRRQIGVKVRGAGSNTRPATLGVTA